MQKYLVVYDGCCNLCSNLVRVLEQLDQGQQFQYLPMQATEALQQWQITPAICEQGMLLVNLETPELRWQGSDAAEEISRLLPGGKGVIDAYRNLPVCKGIGDRIYGWIRDYRYALFGRRAQCYIASTAPECNCSLDSFTSVPSLTHQQPQGEHP